VTLLNSCIDAYEQGCRTDWIENDRAPMAATLRALATELRRAPYRYMTGEEIAARFESAAQS
jgi:hypothetical protein